MPSVAQPLGTVSLDGEQDFVSFPLDFPGSCLGRVAASLSCWRADVSCTHAHQASCVCVF